MMSQRYRLCALQMRIAGHDGFDVAPRDRGKDAPQRPQQGSHLGNLLAQVKAQIQRDLIVAGARRMQLAAGGTDLLGQATLDRQVDVLVAEVEAKPARTDFVLDLTQSSAHFVRFARFAQSDPGQHPGVGDRTKDVVAIEAAIKRQRRAEFLDFF